MIDNLITNFVDIFLKRYTFGVARSSKWASVRDNFLIKKPFCAVCGASKGLEVHHITPVHVNKELELDEDNLIVVCREHHFTFGHLCSWHSYNEDIKTDIANWKIKINNRP